MKNFLENAMIVLIGVVLIVIAVAIVVGIKYLKYRIIGWGLGL